MKKRKGGMGLYQLGRYMTQRGKRRSSSTYGGNDDSPHCAERVSGGMYVCRGVVKGL